MSLEIKRFFDFSFVCGTLSALLGAVVLFGWHTQNELLVQVFPHFVPMQYNTALGFLLSGAGLIALVLGHIRTFLACGAAVAVLGSATLTQYLFGLDYGIDELFMEAYITVKTSHPGRMAPNTALCFSLAGMTLVILGLIKKREPAVISAEALSLTILGLACMALLGYGLSIEQAYGWTDLTRMALHTTFGFLVLAAGFLGYIWKEVRTDITVPLWIPFLILTGIISVELYTPLGVAAGVLYVPLVLCGLWFKRAYIPFLFAGTASLLIVVGYFASPYAAADNHIVLINRGFSMMAVWVTAFVVAAQKRAAHHLQESEYAREAYTEAANDAYWDRFIQDDYEYMSPRFWEMFGYDPKEKKPHPSEWKEIILEDDLEIVLRNFDKHVETKGKHPFHQEVRYHHKNGSIVHVICKGEVVKWDDDGKPLRMIGTHTDITPLKEIQSHLEIANKELEQFAYIASHDLKSPMRGIDNLAKWITRDLQDVMTDDARKRLDLLRSRIKRLEMLLDDILSYSRAGRIVDDPEDVDTGELARDIIDSLAFPEGFRITVTEDMPTITTVQTPLRQILLNLISNAFKHHDRDEGKIEILCKDKGLFYEFTVQDDGPGIPPEFHDRVFQMFQTLQSRDKVESTGLGMAIIRKLVEWQGGKVWIESKDGQRGTAVHFSWPKTYRKARQ